MITPEEVLIYAEIFFVISVGAALSAVLWRAFFIMGRVKRILDFVEHVHDFFETLESVPLAIVQAIVKRFF